MKRVLNTLIYAPIAFSAVALMVYMSAETYACFIACGLFAVIVEAVKYRKIEVKENENLFCDETKQFLNDQLKVDLGNISLSRFSNEPKEFKVSKPNITPNETYYEKPKLGVFLENNKCASCDSEMTHGYCLNGCDDPMGLF